MGYPYLSDPTSRLARLAEAPVTFLFSPAPSREGYRHPRVTLSPGAKLMRPSDLLRGRFRG